MLIEKASGRRAMQPLIEPAAPAGEGSHGGANPDAKHDIERLRGGSDTSPRSQPDRY